ncbi:hypothetical protein MVEG_01213 [Podila verticillata NRRL 6337]|nr:hypothetical protein MVEG_01213 [Podila verticillata NRRL 6337]
MDNINDLFDDDDVFNDANNIHNNDAEFDPVQWDQFFGEFEHNLLDAELEGQIQYEAALVANREEEIRIPRRNEYFFGVDENRARLDDMELEAAVRIENENLEPEDDQDEFEDDRRVQAIVEGIDLVREAVGAVGENVVPDLEVEQQLRDLLPLLQLLALAIQVLFRNWVQIRPRIERPRIPAIRFDLAQVSRPNCQLYFRFYEEDILQIVVALRMPEVVILDNGSKVHCVEALCVVLRQLAYPCRLFDLMDIFGRSQSMLSRIFNHTLRIVYQRWRQRLFWDPVRLNSDKLEEFHHAIRRQNAPCLTSFAFIDGTVRAVCRPVEGQEHIYNGHKRVHAMKYQSIATPDGIIVHLSGPFAGNRHDSRLFEMSGIAPILRTYAKGTNNRQLTLYGDPAYTVSDIMQRPFHTAGISREQKLFNERMSKVRIVNPPTLDEYLHD